jgi:protoporphyrinogen oxidase
MNALPTVIIGCGPAGLTAAHELVKAGLPVLMLEQDQTQVGGLSRTVEYEGFRFDIGGHRFYSKNPEIEALWDEFLGRALESRDRLSRIFFRGKFFKYPLELSDAFAGLGFLEFVACGFSYLSAQLSRRRRPESFEDWMVGAFGRRLFEMFFKTYTEKVWGLRCDEISADWAAQRVRGLTGASIMRAALGMRPRGKGTVKTLIDRFRYPTLGPGEVWQAVAARIRELGAQIQMGERVVRVLWDESGASSVVTVNGSVERVWQGAHFVSTMPIADLIEAFDPPAPPEVWAAAGSLKYRDFLTIAVIIEQSNLFPDQWIYVHDPQVKVARIQNFKNWSSAMVPDDRFTVLGLEYFCTTGDQLWEAKDTELLRLAREELSRLNLVVDHKIVDGVVIRQPKAYPVYDRGYREKVALVRDFVERKVKNLQLVGRNGMHKYNNQDHAMMTGLMAARNLMGESYDVWRVNSDAQYLEEEDREPARMVPKPIGSDPQPSSI